MKKDAIIVVGAKEHNLKNVSVNIPRNTLTVITGMSGSGKSSLAFDTIYAEGQRKYVESLSAYARQFLDQMQKPDVEHIEGLSPAIAIEQRTAGSNPRSIVATTTEIFDYLRLLYASIGKQSCWQCGQPLEQQSAEEIVNRVLDMPEGSRLMVLAPRVQGRKGEHLDIFEEIRKAGFPRARVDGNVVDLEKPPTLEKNKKHTIEAVIDRMVIKPDVRTRLTDSVELALQLGDGILVVTHQASKDAPWEDTLFSEKRACIPCGLSFEELTSRHFSFNSPYGACPTCSGLGAMQVFDEDLVVPDPSLTLNEGAIEPWRKTSKAARNWFNKILDAACRHYKIDMDLPYKKLTQKQKEILMWGADGDELEVRFRRRIIQKSYEGVLHNLARRYKDTDSDYMRQKMQNYMTMQPCPDCHGARLRKESLACHVGNKNVNEVIQLSVRDAIVFFDELTLSMQQQKIVGEVLKEIQARLGFLQNVGLEYLTLDRESGTLSGGEAQRIRLATQIGSGLVGVVYVLDEPSIGLHQRDNRKLIHTLSGLRDTGNTVIVVEHDEETIREADYVIDLGPRAGEHGGEIVFQGSVPQLLRSKKSLTASYLNGKKTIAVPDQRKVPDPKKGEIRITGAQHNNLKKVSVTFPLGLFICVTGVSGSGKSSLVDGILRKALMRHFYSSKERPGTHKGIEGLEKLDKVIVIDQSPIGRTPRSNPATYTGAFSLIRELFTKLPAAKVRGYKPGRFSFNVKGGRCETCKGDGMLKIEMHFLPDVYVPCEVCEGRRYNRETLEIKYRGKSIADVLEMTIEEALDFFEPMPAIRRKFQTLADVGLDYLRLGQPATTLSGGEAQRVKLAAELSKRDTGKTMYLLDEPTTGLHFADVEKLLEVILRLRDQGNTLLVIEHNLDVIKTADYLIDIGPEGGDGGGEVVACGTPEEVAKNKRSYTGAFLKELFNPPQKGAKKKKT